MTRTAKASLERPASRGVSPLIVVTVMSMMVPGAFDLAGLYMTPMRLLYVFTVPYLLVRWMQGAYGRPLVTDYLMFFYILWMAITVGIHHPAQLFTFTGSTGITILGGYLTARATIRSVEDFHAFVRFFAMVVILVLLPLGLYESLSKAGSLPIKWVEAIPFLEAYQDSQYCCRLGLDRAQTVFIHPIHYGVFCSMAFALYFTGLTNKIGFGKRMLVAFLIGVATFMSVSSGAVLVVAFQCGLIGYAMMFHKMPNQWRLMLTGTAILYVILELSTTKFALFSLSQQLSFDPWNVYIRGLLYNAGVEQIVKTPILGFGYNRLPGLLFWMTGSTDNYWLQIAISHGLPGLIVAAGAFLYSMIYVGGTGFTKGSDLYYARVSWTFLMIGLCLSLTTVAIWAEVQSMTFFMLGLGQFMFYAKESDTAPDPVAQTALRPGPVYTRFPTGLAAAAPRPARRLQKS